MLTHVKTGKPFENILEYLNYRDGTMNDCQHTGNIETRSVTTKRYTRCAIVCQECGKFLKVWNE